MNNQYNCLVIIGLWIKIKVKKGETMKNLKQRIAKDGVILPGNIVKVDSFINHQIDVKLLNEMGVEFKERFKNVKVDKILTIEASGIAIAVITAQYFDVPVVFAKKSEARNLDKNAYTSDVYSYAKDKTFPVKVAKEYLLENENILIIDDFLANGKAIEGLIDIIVQAHGRCVGVGIAIEKGFQSGGKKLREAGVKVESLAIIESIEGNQILFR